MSVQEVVLFVSSTSGASTPVLQFVGKNQIPVGIVRLDTPEDRQIAATGKYFQIVNVPALLVIYDDGNLQLFVGQEKIITWFQQIIQKSMQHPQPQHPQPQHPQPQHPQPQHPQHPQHPQPQHPQPQHPQHPQPQQHSSNRSHPQPQPIQRSNILDKKIVNLRKPQFLFLKSLLRQSLLPMKKYTYPPKRIKLLQKKEKSSKKHKRQDKIKKKKPIQFEDEEEIEFFNNEDNKPQSTGLEVGPSYLDKRNPQMENTHKLAQQMQKARQESLSFEEEG